MWRGEGRGKCALSSLRRRRAPPPTPPTRSAADAPRPQISTSLLNIAHLPVHGVPASRDCGLVDDKAREVEEEEDDDGLPRERREGRRRQQRVSWDERLASELRSLGRLAAAAACTPAEQAGAACTAQQEGAMRAVQ